MDTRSRTFLPGFGKKGGVFVLLERLDFSQRAANLNNLNPSAGMKSTESEIDQAQRDLLGKGCDISFFRRFGEILPRVSDDSIESAIAEFHNKAGRLDYWQDRDIGALVLECVADSMQSSNRRCALYRHAMYRAQWCAAGASAGGEGRARSKHVQQIEKKLIAESSALR